MHPRCRSTISAVVEGGKRVAKSKGRNIKVPANVSYTEWRKSLENGKINERITPLGFKRQEHFLTSEENILATNPNFSKSIKYQRNCQRCVPAYEMRMRGYDVVAKPAIIGSIDEFAEKHWREIFKSVMLEKANNKEDIILKMQEWKDGARAEIYIQWDSDSAHVFMAENRLGDICFFDPQTGELDVEYYFKLAKIDEMEFFRIDNLEVNEKYIHECCEEVME